MVPFSIFIFSFVLAIGLAVPNVEGIESPASGRRASKQDHWEQLVMRTVDNFGPGRVLAEGLGDETAHIQDIQTYYSEVFDSNDGWVQGGPGAKTNVKAQSLEGVDDTKSKVSQKTIEGRYIVNLDATSTDHVLDRMVHVLKLATSATKQGLRADHIGTFRHTGKGFTATLNKNMVELVRSHPSVVNIEEDVAVHMKFFDNDEPSNGLQEDGQEVVHQNKPDVPWNLDRLDQHSKILDGQYNPKGTGEGVDVFIIDTGTHYTHKDLEGRAKYFGVDMIDDLTGSTLKGSDCNGHGSHVAGVVGGKKYGVAKKVTIYSVRGLNCAGKGAVSGVVHAMDLIAKFETPNPKVVSLSLGIEASVALNTGLKGLVSDHGIVAVAAAGNQASDSCKYSPASSHVAISVGATDNEDEVVSFSNTGACVHLFAPGSGITSISNTCNSCTTTMSGTSMACPHVTGSVAILLGLKRDLTPAEVLQITVDKSTKGAIDLDSMGLKDTANSTPNRLLYVPALGSAGADM